MFYILKIKIKVRSKKVIPKILSLKNFRLRTKIKIKLKKKSNSLKLNGLSYNSKIGFLSKWSLFGCSSKGVKEFG